MLSKIDPLSTKSWKELKEHFNKMSSVHMKDLFIDCQRFKEFSIQLDDLLFDYSKNRINERTIELLTGLAEECNLSDAIEQMFSGKKINETENRAVLHTALRNFSHDSIEVDGKDIMPEIRDTRKKMRLFSDAVRSGEWRGYSGKKIRSIVNIGIGGSDLGPVMVTEALEYYGSEDLDMYFVSNIDGTHISRVLKKIDPETTLFFIASKTFTTQETMTNAAIAKEWFHRSVEEDVHMKRHFIALSSNKEKVEEFGIDPENMFGFGDYVGGRFSLWSAIGLSIACYVGYDRYEEMLLGAEVVDKHFRNTPFNENIPVLQSLLSIWYINFFNTDSEAILPYEQYLHRFPAYLQQTVMESNGKNIDRSGKPVKYSTSSVIWGEPGTNGPHSFHQLIHQGTKIIPVDFIGGKDTLNRVGDNHKILLSNMLGQSEALMKGKTREDLERSSDQSLNSVNLPYRVFKGNNPSNIFLYDILTPGVLGKLIALYEHKTFVQGIIWNIYSFDQWGVEYGKQLANNIYNELKGSSEKDHDSSTSEYIKLLKK